MLRIVGAVITPIGLIIPGVHVSIKIPDGKFGIVVRNSGKPKCLLSSGMRYYRNILTETVSISDMTMIHPGYTGFIINNKGGKCGMALGPGYYEIDSSMVSITRNEIIMQSQYGIKYQDNIPKEILFAGSHSYNSYINEYIVVMSLIQIEQSEFGVVLKDCKFARRLGPGSYHHNVITGEEIKVVKLTKIPVGHVGIKVTNEHPSHEVLMPGSYEINPYENERCIIVDMRIKTITSTSNCTNKIECNYSYKIVDALKTLNVVSLEATIDETLKGIQSQAMLSNVHRIGLNGYVIKQMNIICKRFGVEIVDYYIKNISLV